MTRAGFRDWRDEEMRPARRGRQLEWLSVSVMGCALTRRCCDVAHSMALAQRRRPTAGDDAASPTLHTHTHNMALQIIRCIIYYAPTCDDAGH